MKTIGISLVLVMIMLSGLILAQDKEENNNSRTEYGLCIDEEKSKKVKLKITGMTCAGCSNHVITALNRLDGVENVELEYPGDVATVTYDSDKTGPKAMIKQIEKIEYSAKVVK